MGEHQRERRRRDPVDPRRLAEGSGPDARELQAAFGRKPANRSVVESIGQGQAFIPAECEDVGLLTLEIAGIAGVDLELLDDIRLQCTRAPARSR